MLAWFVATLAYDVALAKSGRRTLSEEMRDHPALTALGLAALVVHLLNPPRR